MSSLPKTSLTPATPEARRAYTQTLLTAQSYRAIVCEIGRLRSAVNHLDAQILCVSRPGALRGRRLVAEVEEAEQRTDALLQQERDQAQKLLACKLCLKMTGRGITDPAWLALVAHMVETVNRLLGLRSLLFSWDLSLYLDQIRIPADIAISGQIQADSAGSHSTATDDETCSWREVSE